MAEDERPADAPVSSWRRYSAFAGIVMAVAIPLQILFPEARLPGPPTTTTATTATTTEPIAAFGFRPETLWAAWNAQPAYPLRPHEEAPDEPCLRVPEGVDAAVSCSVREGAVSEVLLVVDLNATEDQVFELTSVLIFGVGSAAGLDLDRINAAIEGEVAQLIVTLLTEERFSVDGRVAAIGHVTISITPDATWQVEIRP